MSSLYYDPTLSLNLGSQPTTAPNPQPHPQQSPPNSAFNLSLSLSLSAPTVTTTHTHTTIHTRGQQSQHATSPRSGVSSLSLSNGSAPAPTAVTGKRRERDPPMPAASGTASEEVDRNHSSKSAAGSDDEEDELVGGDGGAHSNVRKKLRLTKDQSALLEESFKLHSTLNPKQKTALAKQLNLRPRQVEVWFQNRRARTKFKQTEVDCEFLKKWCESLTNENRRLQKEVQELRAVKVAAVQPPYYMQLPSATLTMCPSCERVTSAASTTAAAGGGEVRRL